MYDLVFRDATIVDGTGAPAFRGDVAVRGDRIAAVGGEIGPGRREVACGGLHLLPGWVDVHTHYDAQITWDPLVSPSSGHGVTTVVMGNCGVGFAPVAPDRHAWLIGLMEGVEDIPGSALTEGLKFAWESFPEYLDALERHPRAVDFATQVPHSAVRAYVMGERGARNEDATADDIAAMAEIVREGIAAGALGFSTSRTLLHKGIDGRYVPGTFAAEEELMGIARGMAAGGPSVLQLTATHTNVPDELPWMQRVAESTGVTVAFNIVQTDDAPELWRDVLTAFDARPELPMLAQVAARPVGILMQWGGSAHPFLPVPAYLEVHFLPIAERIERLRDPALRARICAEEPLSVGPFEDSVVKAHHKMYRLGNPPDYEPAPETSAAEVAKREGRTAREVVYDWLMEDDGRGTVYFPLFNYSNGNMDHLETLMTHPRSFVGLGDGGAHCGAICDASIPTYLLTWWGRDRPRGTLPIEALVERQTRRTAAAYGLLDRGAIQPGLRADLNVVDLDALTIDPPRMVYDLPAGGRRLVQAAHGYRLTTVGGVVTFEDGKHTGALPGRLIRGRRAEA